MPKMKLEKLHTITGKQFAGEGQDRVLDPQSKFDRKLREHWPTRKGIVNKDYIEVVKEFPGHDSREPIDKIYD